MRRNAALAAFAALCAILDPGRAAAYAYYGYDAAGRVATALYDTEVCVVYSYDANGNRAAETSNSASPPETATWGTGSWGCFPWTAQ